PADMTLRSPRRFTIHPAAGLLINRMKAKTLITALAAKAETPKVRAKSGIAGITIPKPSATQKAIAASTVTSRGSPPIRGTHDFTRATIAAAFAMTGTGRDWGYGPAGLLQQ